MMTTQDFAAIAAILAGDYACASLEGKRVILCTSLSLADYFQKANPEFRRDLFYDAVFGRGQDTIRATLTTEIPAPDYVEVVKPDQDDYSGFAR